LVVGLGLSSEAEGEIDESQYSEAPLRDLGERRKEEGNK